MNHGQWRLAHPQEDVAIIQLCLSLYSEDPSTESISAPQIQRTLEALRAAPIRGRALVLDVAGTLSGYAFLISYWSNELGGEVCTIDEIYVAPQARGQGWGRALMESLISGNTELWPTRPAALQLEVSPKNANARRLYERLGFSAIRNTYLRKMVR